MALVYATIPLMLLAIIIAVGPLAWAIRREPTWRANDLGSPVTSVPRAVEHPLADVRAALIRAQLSQLPATWTVAPVQLVDQWLQPELRADDEWVGVVRIPV